MKTLTNYSQTLEVGDILPESYGSMAGRGIGSNTKDYRYKVTYISDRGDFEAARILPSGKPSKRIVQDLWSDDTTKFIPGGERSW